MTQRMMNLVVRKINAAGIKAKLTKVQKNNLTMIGVTIGDGTIRPTMYFTEEFEGMTSKAIAELMIMRYENLSKTPEFDIREIMTREYIKEHVHMMLVPYSDYVKDKAARSFLDLFKLFYIDTPIEGGKITLTIDHITKLGIEVAELEAWAHDTYEVKGMFETMMELDPETAEMLGEPDHEEQFVLSNSNKNYGAAAITSKAVLDLACKRLGADTIYILPSSIHECLAVAMGEPEELRQMVCAVNNTKLAPQNRLSYNVYRYTTGGELEIA